MIVDKPNEIRCPEDGKEEEFYSTDRGIDSFPINFALKSILEKHSKELSKGSNDSKPVSL